MWLPFSHVLPAASPSPSLFVARLRMCCHRRLESARLCLAGRWRWPSRCSAALSPSHLFQIHGDVSIFCCCCQNVLIAIREGSGEHSPLRLGLEVGRVLEEDRHRGGGCSGGAQAATDGGRTLRVAGGARTRDALAFDHTPTGRSSTLTDDAKIGRWAAAQTHRESAATAFSYPLRIQRPTTVTATPMHHHNNDRHRQKRMTTHRITHLHPLHASNTAAYERSRAEQKEKVSSILRRHFCTYDQSLKLMSTSFLSTSLLNGCCLRMQHMRDAC